MAFTVGMSWSSGSRWICICAADRLPKVAVDNHDTSCFTACNCSSGSFVEAQSLKKQFSSKVVVVILLLCAILMTVAFIASASCYVYRRDRCHTKGPLFSSDRETSFNSATNLISQRATSVPEFNIYLGSPVNPITGCIRKASFLCRSRRRGTTNGRITQFSYYELENATNKFSDSNLIGAGGSSHVYCGHLRDGRIVAVKKMKVLGGPDAEYIFLTEIELISRLHHCHVVPLLGYCSEYQGKHAEMLLVFECMTNGNLRECLDRASEKCLDWGTRVAIALGAARGLEYLHDAAAPRILHRDVKSTNILLDENWRAKITDLGMAKCLRTDGLPSCSSSPARMQGTFGYFAPEYAIIGRSSLKSDVFSFGVVLLELITGRQPIQKSADKGEESLAVWAMLPLQDSMRVILELPDPNLKGNFPQEEMQIMAYLAKECLLLDPDSRPTMSEIVQILSTISPGKSRRRNFRVNLFQSLSTRSIKSGLEMDIPNKQVGSVEAEEPVNSSRWAARCSLPLNIDRTLCIEMKEKEADTASAECLERLIFLASNSRSWRVQDDEAVDLTEPRFESFHVANVGSS
ncbi:hypothetical protein RJ639_019193 [Escallonia herrerae]|uniref:non-specific serine/threonine protein kinase n=1 Tax=Escallonia herrerae TaxID=1293975 RepID=A0AA88V6J8_9ASTE|nr:hypothetical protein RJ639_019193 [Escallonia herrerae]